MIISNATILWHWWHRARIKRERIFNEIKAHNYYLHSNYKPITFVLYNLFISTISYYYNPIITGVYHYTCCFNLLNCIWLIQQNIVGWLQLKNDQKLDKKWSEIDLKLDKNWSKTGQKLVYNWTKLVKNWSKTGQKLSKIGLLASTIR